LDFRIKSQRRHGIRDGRVQTSHQDCTQRPAANAIQILIGRTGEFVMQWFVRQWFVRQWQKRPVLEWGLFVLCVWIPTPMVSGQTKFGAKIADVVAAECGIDFNHTDGQSGKRYMVETVTGSLALFDYDNDGLVDIYFVNGAPLPG
jgi:hypothetical protein